MGKELISDGVYYVPEERTINYENAVAERPEVLKSVPIQFRNYDICQKAVIGDPNMIKYVPVQIITQDFVDVLIGAGVSIPKKYQNYVKLCVEFNANNYNLDSRTSVEDKTEKVIPEAIKNIMINDLENLFSLHTINLIKQYGIFTLRDLIIIVDNPILCIEYFGITAYYDEIVNTVRLLKCKYLNEDPIININDEQECSEEFFKLLGLRVLSQYFLSFWKGKSVKDFFSSINEASTEKQLMRIRNFGKQQVGSLIERANIVLDYYAKHSENTISPTNEALKSAIEEFKKLKDERQRLDEQMELVLQKIQELTMKQLHASEMLEKKQRLG